MINSNGVASLCFKNQVNLMAMKKLQSQIIALKKKKNAVLLAHYYQAPEIQEIADYVGDSLGLSQQAEQTQADLILFAGVHFMAETAKLLNPNKKVILPDLYAGCSLADSCPPDAFKKFIDAHPNHYVVTYVNCSAQIKAMSDLVCTSSNAEKMVRSVPADRPIIFAPDKNLGHYIQEKTGRKMLLWDGSCVVHEAFSLDKLIALHQLHPQAHIIAHPESEPHILKVARFVGSTAALIDYVKKSTATEFIIATEVGILYKMQQEVPDKKLIPAPSFENNTCACSQCAYMKLNTLQKVFDCLYSESPEIKLDAALVQKAVVPIKRMLALS